MKPFPRHLPIPPLPLTAEASLRQQERDFTGEGSPPPGRVGPGLPKRPEPTTEDRPARRR